VTEGDCQRLRPQQFYLPAVVQPPDFPALLLRLAPHMRSSALPVVHRRCELMPDAFRLPNPHRINRRPVSVAEISIDNGPLVEPGGRRAGARTRDPVQFGGRRAPSGVDRLCLIYWPHRSPSRTCIRVRMMRRRRGDRSPIAPVSVADAPPARGATSSRHRRFVTRCHSIGAVCHPKAGCVTTTRSRQEPY